MPIDDRPGMTELPQIQTRDGKHINLLQSIGPHADKFGTCLLVDYDGVKMSTLKTDHRSVEQVTRQIFIEWLQGKSKIHTKYSNGWIPYTSVCTNIILCPLNICGAAWHQSTFNSDGVIIY